MTRRDHAQKQADAWEAEALDPSTATRARATLGGVLAAWLAHLDARVREGQMAAGTRHCYGVKASALVTVLEHGGDPKAERVPLPLAAVTVDTVRRHTAARTAAGIAAHTIHKELVALRSALRLARERGELDRDPVEIVPHYRPRYVPRDRHLSTEEIASLLAHLPKARAAWVAFALATGAERGAVERARRADVQSDRRKVEIRGTKNAARARVVEIVFAWQRSLITFALAHADGRDGMLFSPWSGVGCALSRACETLKIAHASPNDLRRTTCHMLLASGVAQAHAGAFLGHTSSQMVARVYGRLSAREVGAHLAAAAEHNDALAVTVPT